MRAIKVSFCKEGSQHVHHVHREKGGEGEEGEEEEKVANGGHEAEAAGEAAGGKTSRPRSILLRHTVPLLCHKSEHTSKRAAHKKTTIVFSHQLQIRSASIILRVCYYSLLIFCCILLLRSATWKNNPKIDFLSELLRYFF